MLRIALTAWATVLGTCTSKTALWCAKSKLPNIRRYMQIYLMLTHGVAKKGQFTPPRCMKLTVYATHSSALANVVKANGSVFLGIKPQKKWRTKSFIFLSNTAQVNSRLTKVQATKPWFASLVLLALQP